VIATTVVTSRNVVAMRIAKHGSTNSTYNYEQGTPVLGLQQYC